MIAMYPWVSGCSGETKAQLSPIIGIGLTAIEKTLDFWKKIDI